MHASTPQRSARHEGAEYKKMAILGCAFGSLSDGVLARTLSSSYRGEATPATRHQGGIAGPDKYWEKGTISVLGSGGRKDTTIYLDGLKYTTGRPSR